MLDDNEKSATKTDISLLKAELATKTELREEIKSVKTELTAQINRVAAAVVNTQADVRRIEQAMATKDDISRVLKAIDAFAGKSESDHNAVVLHGRILTDVQVGLKDHEGRLNILASTRP
ncbi:MAG: hypothetical protein A2X37_07805 [Elusimicrobia bacterium GWA2_66_18]|nr:MAG: hypothetical protein A2X37_07805 [Elusimicrobia bacterium GWA2_66_18]